MHIKILGPMVKQTEILLQNTAIALKKLKVKATFERISEFHKAADYGAIAFPALVVDEKIVHVGGILSVEELKALFNSLI